MKLMTGMVISSVKAPNTYNEIVRLYKENGEKMVEISQFSKKEVGLRFEQLGIQKLNASGPPRRYEGRKETK